MRFLVFLAMVFAILFVFAPMASASVTDDNSAGGPFEDGRARQFAQETYRPNNVTKYFKTTVVKKYYSSSVSDKRIAQGVSAMRNSMSSGNITTDMSYLIDSAANMGWVEKRADGSFKWIKNPSDAEIAALLTHGMQKEIRADRKVLKEHGKQLENHEGRLQVVEGKLGVNSTSPSSAPTPSQPAPQPIATATVQIAGPTGPAGWIAWIGGWLIQWTGNGIAYFMAIIVGIGIVSLAIWAMVIIVRRIWAAIFNQNQPAGAGFAGAVANVFPFVGAPNNW